MTIDISAWKTDDKAWMKERRAGWKDIKNTIDQLTSVRGRDKKFLKTFYLTGEINIDEMRKVFGRRWTDPDKPFLPMEASILYECWLTADQSDDNWNRIKESYEERRSRAMYDSCREFLGTLDYYPESGALFGGLEERLYHFLCPTRCRPEDYPHLNREQYISAAWGVYGKTKMALIEFLKSESPNPNNFVRYRLSEWRDSIAPTFVKIPKELLDALHQIVKPAHNIINNPTAYSDVVVDVAKEVEAILKDESLPQPIRDKVDEIINNVNVVRRTK